MKKHSSLRVCFHANSILSIEPRVWLKSCAEGKCATGLKTNAMQKYEQKVHWSSEVGKGVWCHLRATSSAPPSPPSRPRPSLSESMASFLRDKCRVTLGTKKLLLLKKDPDLPSLAVQNIKLLAPLIFRSIRTDASLGFGNARVY